MSGRLLLAGLLAATLVFAQGKGGKKGGGGGDSMMSMPRPQHMSKAEQVAEKLKLSKEQKDQLTTILSAGSEKAGSIRTQMDSARANIAGAMIDGKDEDAKKLLNDYTAVSAQMTALEADTFSKIFATLKPNQQSKAPEAFDLMAGIFNPSPAAGMGGGMGRGMGRSGKGR